MMSFALVLGMVLLAVVVGVLFTNWWSVSAATERGAASTTAEGDEPEEPAGPTPDEQVEGSVFQTPPASLIEGEAIVVRVTFLESVTQEQVDQVTVQWELPEPAPRTGAKLAGRTVDAVVNSRDPVTGQGGLQWDFDITPPAPDVPGADVELRVGGATALTLPLGAALPAANFTLEASPAPPERFGSFSAFLVNPAGILVATGTTARTILYTADAGEAWLSQAISGSNGTAFVAFNVDPTSGQTCAVTGATLTPDFACWNGSVWLNGPTDVTTLLHNVIAGPARAVALGGKAYFRTDGDQALLLDNGVWTVLDFPSNIPALMAAPGPDGFTLFYGSSANGALALYSSTDDGATLTGVGTDAVSTVSWSDVQYVAELGLFVGVGTTPGDGPNFKHFWLDPAETTPVAQVVQGPVAANSFEWYAPWGCLVACGNGNALEISYEGLVWEELTLTLPTPLPTGRDFTAAVLDATRGRLYFAGDLIDIVTFGLPYVQQVESEPVAVSSALVTPRIGIEEGKDVAVRVQFNREVTQAEVDALSVAWTGISPGTATVVSRAAVTAAPARFWDFTVTAANLPTSADAGSAQQLVVGGQTVLNTFLSVAVPTAFTAIKNTDPGDTVARRVVYDYNGTLVAAGTAANTIRYSTDGTMTWNEITVGTGGQSFVHFNENPANGKVMAITDSTTPDCWESVNGIVWTQVSPLPGTVNSAPRVASTGGQGSPRILNGQAVFRCISDWLLFDGSTWTDRPVSPNLLLTTVEAPSTGVALAVTNNVTGGAYPTSDEGATFGTGINVGTRYRDVTYSAALGKFVAVGDSTNLSVDETGAGGVVTTTTGINNNASIVEFPPWGCLLAGGASGSVQASLDGDEWVNVTGTFPTGQQTDGWTNLVYDETRRRVYFCAEVGDYTDNLAFYQPS